MVFITMNEKSTQFWRLTVIARYKDGVDFLFLVMFPVYMVTVLGWQSLCFGG